RAVDRLATRRRRGGDLRRRARRVASRSVGEDRPSRADGSITTSTAVRVPRSDDRHPSRPLSESGPTERCARAYTHARQRRRATEPRSMRRVLDTRPVKGRSRTMPFHRKRLARAIARPEIAERSRFMTAGSLIVLSACLPLPCALAQQPGAASGPIEEVFVTGTRLARDGFSSPTPVTAVSAEDLLAVRPTTVVETLAELPAFGNSTTRRSIGGSTAAGPGSFLDLRGLGATRNLVLLDGRRAPPSNISGSTDINMLPQSLIQRVEVVTGGASAAYGTDAVAGVSNFILDKTFEGFKADFSAGATAKNDGENTRVSLAGGHGFLGGRLHVIASVDQFRSEPEDAHRREWA